jgi:hypothetical protein
MLNRILKIGGLTLLVGAVLGLTSSPGVAGENVNRPNWKGSAYGTTAPDPDNPGVDCDVFAGESSHIDLFTAEGCHSLHPDFTFDGYATWIAENGESLNVTYSGFLFPSGDPDFPFGFLATLDADGGTGRLSDAQGSALMQGAFSGVPGELFFDFEGTVHPQGK